MKKPVNAYNLYKTKFRTLTLSEPWNTLIGTPELTGTWFIYGLPKNGKTSFALQLCKYMTEFSRVFYDSIEEGQSLSFVSNVRRCRMLEDTKNRFCLLDKYTVDELRELLDKKNSPNFIVLDSVQFADLRVSEYKALKADYPKKIFLYISHVKGNGEPDGATANFIRRDSSVIFRVEGFRAFVTSRFGGSGYYDIAPSMAQAYWGMENK